jgi:hypothetical protein
MQSTGENTEDTKAPDCFSQLGILEKIPVEIRFLIWEKLFALIPSTQLKDTATTTNTLSIIASSRFLCNEISHHLYARLNHEISFWPHTRKELVGGHKAIKSTS